MLLGGVAFWVVDVALGGDELLPDGVVLLELLGVDEDEVSVDEVELGVEVEEGIAVVDALLLAVEVGGVVLLVVVSLWLQADAAAPAARMTIRGINFFMSSPD